MRTLILGLLLGVLCILQSTRAADTSWERDYALRGLTALRVEVIEPSTERSQSVKELVRQGVTEALLKSGLRIGGSTIMFVKITRVDQEVAKPPAYYLELSVSERFVLQRDPSVFKSEYTWNAIESFVLTGDHDAAVSQGVARLMAKFTESLRFANETRGNTSREARPGT